MYFKPIDEMSLRHLFSSDCGRKVLKMEYLGPVLNASGAIEDSPDCLILDKRDEKEIRILRCEFKFIPSCKEDFSRNGQFDIAIVWKINPPLTKQKLKDELATQNGCQEIIVLSEYSDFNNLKEYHICDVAEVDNISELKTAILKMKNFPPVIVAFIAAKISPREFNGEKMIKFLAKNYAEVKRIKPKGRGSIIGALLQSKMPLVRKLRSNFYCWNESINANIAVVEIEQILRNNFRRDIPSHEIINSFENDTIT